ncbi:MAG: methionine aminotransferase, partial [Bacteroidota bacterium]
MSLQFDSKLPNVGTTIFTVMSKLSNDYNAINLAQGFPNWDCDPLLQELVNKHISAGKNQYAPMAGVPKLLNRLAEKAKDLYDINIDIKNEIVVTAGATQAIY